MASLQGKTLKVLFLCLSAVVMVLLAAEIILRVFFGFANQPIYVTDDDIGYLLKADQHVRFLGKTYSCNKYHQRSEELMDEPDYRILMVGDSLLHGVHPVDQHETIPELLEARINRELGLNGEVLNASAPSWSIDNELEYVKRFGLFEADVVILVINNADIYQEKSTPEYLYATGRHTKRPFSALYELYREFFKKDDSSYISKPEDATEIFNRHRKMIFQDLAGMVKRAGNKFILVMIPPERKNTKTGTTELVYNSKSLSSTTEEEEFMVIDFVNGPSPIEKGDYLDQIHMNKKGNQRIADIIYEQVHEIIARGKL